MPVLPKSPERGLLRREAARLSWRLLFWPRLTVALLAGAFLAAVIAAAVAGYLTGHAKGAGLPGALRDKGCAVACKCGYVCP